MTEREAFLAAVAEEERNLAKWQERRSKMTQKEREDADWKVIMDGFRK